MFYVFAGSRDALMELLRPVKLRRRLGIASEPPRSHPFVISHALSPVSHFFTIHVTVLYVSIYVWESCPPRPRASGGTHPPCPERSVTESSPVNRCQNSYVLLSHSGARTGSTRRLRKFSPGPGTGFPPP